MKAKIKELVYSIIEPNIIGEKNIPNVPPMLIIQIEEPMLSSLIILCTK